MRTPFLLAALLVAGWVQAAPQQAVRAAAAKRPPAVPAAPVEVELAHQLDEVQAERLQPLIDRFNSSHKDYQVRLLRRVEGEAPKLLNLVTREQLSGFVAQRAQFKPVSDLMRAEKMALDPARLSPELRAGIADTKGRLVALPVALATPVLYINKEAFRAAGLDPEAPPRTWFEVQQAADKLFDAGSKCPYTTSWPAWVHVDNLSVWNDGGIADDKGRLVFNGMVQVKHIAMLSSWYKSRFFVTFGHRDEAEQRFADGECGMLTGSSALYARIHDKPGIEVGVSTLPYHDDVRGAPQHTLADGASLWVAAGRKPAEYKGAAQLVSFLLTPEVQVALTARGGFLPMTPAANAAVKSSALREGVVAVKVAQRQLQGRTAARSLRVSQIEPLRIIVEDELDAVWADRKPAKKALDDAVERGNAVLPRALKESPVL